VTGILLASSESQISIPRPTLNLKLALNPSLNADEFEVDRKLLYSMIDWRIKDLKGVQPETIDALELYAEGTQTAMMNLTLQCMGEFQHKPTIHAVSRF